MEFFRPYLKERHGARTQLAAALGVCYGSARKAKLRMSLTAHCCRSHPPQDAAMQPVEADIRCSAAIVRAANSHFADLVTVYPLLRQRLLPENQVFYKRWF
jgi:hypothetical protein